MKSLVPASLALALSLALPLPAQAGLGSKAAGELAEFLMKKFGKEVASEGAERLAGRLVKAAARHGDDVLAAVRKVGPKAIALADDAGVNAPSVLRLLNHYGDDDVRALSRPKGMALVGRYGADAARALIKHKGIAEPLLDSMGMPAVKAINALGPQAGRRLAMMAGDDLAAIGRTPELLEVIARHGDRALDFIWKHKAVLAGSAALAAFLRDPEPFLNGTAELTHAVSESVVKPAAAAVAGTLKPGFAAAGDAIRPVIMDAAEATRKFALWAGGWLLIAILSFFLAVRMVARSGFLGKLIVRTGFKLAGGRIAGAIRKK
jgi:hypothetical protein